MIKVLAVVWALGVVVHAVLRLHDLRLWLGFPLLLAPWLLFGPSNWLDR